MFSRTSVRVSLVVVGVCAAFALAQRGPETAIRGNKRFRKSVVISGLANPWEITMGPDGMLWTTERSGKRVVRIDPRTGNRQVALTLEEVSAPGGQDGLLGMALHPELLKGRGQDYVWLSYTYVDKERGADPNIANPNSPYRYLYMKIARFTYDQATGQLGARQDVISGMPSGNDHNAGRLKYGPDGKLYLTIGDQGHNQLGNWCLPVESQTLPTQSDVDKGNYWSYQGKSLRINVDGSIPKDNPRLDGVVSHIFTLGHRNPQGIDFSPDGILYSSEQGPKADDEVNILKKGGNYGWPNVSGYRDNKAYEFARWAEATIPCREIRFSDLAIHESVPRQPETAFTKPMVDPLATLFTVPAGYNFADPACGGIDYICWPTVAASSIEHYEAGASGIPGWNRVLLVTTLKRGSLYVIPLNSKGTEAAGPIYRFFQSENRFRDTAVSPDKRTIYIATDSRGVVNSWAGGVATRMQNPGAILAYTYVEEGEEILDKPVTTSEASPSGRPGRPAIQGGVPPRFTTAQIADGKVAYNANCAVCHGNNMMNGTMGTPLAGPYFKKQWSGRSVRAFYDRTQKSMPPAAPGSLPKDVYANIVAYILEVNGAKPGSEALDSGAQSLEKMVIP